jgi:hypothetical protein
MLKPLKCVLVEYKTLILKMAYDNASIAQMRLNLDLHCDVHRLLDLFCLLPFLKVVNALIKFTQGKDVFNM